MALILRSAWRRIRRLPRRVSSTALARCRLRASPAGGRFAPAGETGPPPLAASVRLAAPLNGPHFTKCMEAGSPPAAAVFIDCFCEVPFEGQPCGRSLRSCRRNRSPPALATSVLRSEAGLAVGDGRFAASPARSVAGNYLSPPYFACLPFYGWQRTGR